ncbi:MAG: hypothetical protein JRJ47_09235 [Deltaproteobacteria bacterium]|nr:hypothetical protein [Deltaproteobacteria bacterium]
MAGAQGALGSAIPEPVLRVGKPHGEGERADKDVGARPGIHVAAEATTQERFDSVTDNSVRFMH